MIAAMPPPLYATIRYARHAIFMLMMSAATRHADRLLIFH